VEEESDERIQQEAWNNILCSKRTGKRERQRI